MDLSGGDRSVDQPSPATISSQSRGGSTSHSSYSPGQQTDQQHHLPYRASPKPVFTGLNNMPPGVATAFPSFPGTGSAATASTSAAGTEFFGNANAFSGTGGMGDENFNPGFLMGNEWEYGALNGQGSGMTPMSEGSWNQMLESVTLGWEGVGPSHPTPPGGSGGRGR